MATKTRKTMCPVQKKQMYPTRGAAIKAALSYSKKRGTPLRYFWHVDCQSFHLTSRARW